MKAKARTARQILNARRAAAKAARNGLHTLASHARKAGLDGELATGVAGALRAKAKVAGVIGVKVRMTRRAEVKGRVTSVPVRGARKYSKADFLALALAYAPRLAKYVAARNTLLAY
jgi:hypothetical protein